MKTKFAFFAAASILCGATVSVIATTIKVTSLNDGGPGTLRASLISATDGDTVDATGVSGTILLTSGELLINKSVTILGPGPNNLAVDGNDASRVFHIGSNCVVSLSGLIVTNGFQSGPTTPTRGAGIYNDHGTLTIRQCVITGNYTYQGAGICNDALSGAATLTIADSTISNNLAQGNAGGILNFGILGTATMSISNCTILGNAAGSYYGGNAGGVENLGQGQQGFGTGSATMAICVSTIAYNSAGNAGGGIFNDASGGIATLTMSGSAVFSNAVSNGSGGGIWVHQFQGTSSLGITNSTISGNSAYNVGGAINNNSGSVAILNSTISGNTAFNSAAIYTDGTLKIGSMILDIGSQGVTTPNGASIISLGYNLVRNSFIPFFSAQPTDLLNTNPMLGPLQDNGGPTWTHALLLGSPAIDKGKNFSTSATDQRGYQRDYDNPGIPNATAGDGTDIGAFEFIPPMLSIAPNFGNVVLSWSTNDPGYTVESTSVLPNSGSWTPVSGTPLLIGNQYLLEDGPVTDNKFYRLRSP